jgi:hypothetical protein
MEASLFVCLLVSPEVCSGSIHEELSPFFPIEHEVCHTPTRRHARHRIFDPSHTPDELLLLSFIYLMGSRGERKEPWGEREREEGKAKVGEVEEAKTKTSGRLVRLFINIE